MNWGTKIMIVYILFIGGILSLVVLSARQNQDLVIPDYYEQELKYQQKIDQIARTNALSAPVQCRQEGNMIALTFPKEMQHALITADVLLYSPSDKERDVRKTIKTGDGALQFPIPAVPGGMYILKIAWTADSAHYYYEHKIMIS